MRTTVRLATGVAVLSFASVAAAPAAVAQTVDCAVYPDRCVPTDVVVDRTPDAQPTPDSEPTPDVEPTPVVVADNEANRSTTSSTPSTLPFTGGEIVLLSVLGAGALAAGTALVVAGRRRGSTTA